MMTSLIYHLTKNVIYIVRATIAIAALYDFYGVLCGTMLAYACTIMIAIFVGHIVSKFLSEKQMGLIGGIVFLLFALQILLYKLGIFTWH